MFKSKEYSKVLITDEERALLKDAYPACAKCTDEDLFDNFEDIIVNFRKAKKYLSERYPELKPEFFSIDDLTSYTYWFRDPDGYLDYEFYCSYYPKEDAFGDSYYTDILSRVFMDGLKDAFAQENLNMHKKSSFVISTMELEKPDRVVSAEKMLKKYKPVCSGEFYVKSDNIDDIIARIKRIAEKTGITFSGELCCSELFEDDMDLEDMYKVIRENDVDSKIFSKRDFES